MMRFYLDEMLSFVIAAILRASGIDCVSAVELGHVSTADAVHLAFAAQEGRCLVTRDYHDFPRLTSSLMDQGLPHAGVFFVPKSMRGRDVGGIAAALVHFASQYPDGLAPYSLLWLSRPPA